MIVVPRALAYDLATDMRADHDRMMARGDYVDAARLFLHVDDLDALLEATTGDVTLTGDLLDVARDYRDF